MVQLHNNGEALLYPRFGEAAKLFKNQITNIVTNGKLLVEKSEDIIDNQTPWRFQYLKKMTKLGSNMKLLKIFKD